MRFLFISLCLIPIIGNAKTSKVICELEGTYSVSYKDIKKKYLSDGIELFKNLARQSQASLFLLKRAKTNFAAEDWEKDKIVSTYTLDGAVMATDRLVKTLQLGRAPDVGNVETKEEEEEVELNDFGDISIMYDILEKEGIVGGDNDPPIRNNKIILDASAFAFRVVLEKYDAASIRDHMVRTRQLLEGNAPHLTTLTSGHELDDLVMQEEEGVKGEEAETAAAVAEKKDGVDKEDGKTRKEEVVSLIFYNCMCVYHIFSYNSIL